MVVQQVHNPHFRRKRMKRVCSIILTVFLGGVLFLSAVSCSKEDAVQQERARDNLSSLQEEIVRDVPEVSRLCDELDLEKQRINVGDCELYCEVEGKGTPVVLLHGGPGSTHHGFHPHFSRAKKFARVIYYDQRGTGISDYERGDRYTLDQAVGDLESLRKALNIDKWVVLGHSYGGLLAQYYSTQHPESVMGLVLVCSSLGMHVQQMPTRQYDYISDEERQKIREIHRSLLLNMEQKLFNAHLNGDWKRQNYYKPTREALARMARYEWQPAPRFRSDMSRSIGRIDLEGAFEGCPIPTLIIEGTWDLTWNTDKPGILHDNHPGSQMVLFENSAHSPFEDEPKLFFKTLKKFVKELSPVSDEDTAGWQDYLVQRQKKLEKSPAHILRTSGHGCEGYQKIATLYSEEWLSQLDHYRPLLQLGYALYISERYEEALRIFEKAEEVTPEDSGWLVLTLIWQGHMLDLLGRRSEAVSVYQRVVDMNDTSQWQQSQFGMKFRPSPYAKERIKEPFKRIECVE